MLFALLPAAGHSTRMGRPKLSLPLGECTVIEHVIAILKRAGIEKVLVVIGPHVAELEGLATRAGASVLLLPEATPDMRTTVERGLDWIETNWRPGDDDAFLLVPADHPVLDAKVIQMLCSRSRETSDSSNRSLTTSATNADVRIPTFRSQRGHPTLIGWQHVAGIRTLPANVGLNAYLRAHPEAVLEVPVESESILFDMDTPADYERIKELVSRDAEGFRSGAR